MDCSVLRQVAADYTDEPLHSTTRPGTSQSWDTDVTCMLMLERPGLWFGRTDTLSGVSESRDSARRVHLHGHPGNCRLISAERARWGKDHQVPLSRLNSRALLPLV